MGTETATQTGKKVTAVIADIFLTLLMIMIVIYIFIHLFLNEVENWELGQREFAEVWGSDPEWTKPLRQGHIKQKEVPRYSYSGRASEGEPWKSDGGMPRKHASEMRARAITRAMERNLPKIACHCENLLSRVKTGAEAVSKGLPFRFCDPSDPECNANAAVTCGNNTTSEYGAMIHLVGGAPTDAVAKHGFNRATLSFQSKVEDVNDLEKRIHKALPRLFAKI